MGSYTPKKGMSGRPRIYGLPDVPFVWELIRIDLAAGKLLAHDWRNLGAEQLDGAHDLTVRHGADIDVKEETCNAGFLCSKIIFSATYSESPTYRAPRRLRASSYAARLYGWLQPRSRPMTFIWYGWKDRTRLRPARWFPRQSRVNAWQSAAC